MDWTRPINALIPGLEGEVLYRLWLVDQPQTAGQIHKRGNVGSVNGVRMALSRLTEQGIVQSRQIGHTYAFFLNTDHLAYPALNAALKHFDPYNELRRRLHDLVKETWPTQMPTPSLSIYGSVAKKAATTESDLDLLLVFREEDRGTLYLNILTDELHTKPEEWTGNDVHLYSATYDDLARSKATGDPMVASWLETADTVAGPTFAQALKGGAA